MEKCAEFRKRNANQNSVPIYLAEAVRLYPTPTVQDAKNNGSQSQANRNTPPLNVVPPSTFSPVVSLVNPSVLQESVRELVTHVSSGTKCSASYARFSPFGYWEKTSGVCSPLMEVEPSEPSSMNWPRWGIAWDGACTELAMSVPRIVVKESSLWRTPTAEEAGARLETLSTKEGEPAQVGKRAYRTQPDGKRVLQSVTLGQQVRMYPTPTTHEIEHPEAELTDSGWRKTKDGKDSHSLNLADTVKMWPTPRNCTAMGAEFTDNTQGAKFPNLETIVAREEDANSGSLNPTWVEWLMGFPTGWTALEP